MDLVCRTLSGKDYDAIVELWARSGLPFKPNGRDGRTMLEAEMQRHHCSFIGLFDNDRMIAVGIASFDGRRGWINRVAVDPDFRGRGLGSRMIDECEKFINSFGETVPCALIEDENTPSMACFKKAGFVYEGYLQVWTKRPRPDL